MTIKRLALQLLLAFVIHSFSVTEASDCSFTWFGVTSEINSTTINIIFSKSIMNHNITCPNSVYGYPDEVYCCYDFNGKATCCDSKHFIFMGFFFFSLIFIITLTCWSMYLISSSCCSICKRRKNVTLTSFLHLVPIEHLPHKTHW